VKVLYFAWVREKIGVSEESIAPPTHVTTLAELMDWLSQRSSRHATAFQDRRLIRAAIDQVHSRDTDSIAGAREIAFFPPVTGG
jgi:molybdopterin synthase sulfur carrier subunit